MMTKEIKVTNYYCHCLGVQSDNLTSRMSSMSKGIKCLATFDEINHVTHVSF